MPIWKPTPRKSYSSLLVQSSLNNLELWGADIGSAYLEAYTHENLFIIAGPEFEELEGCILIFNKALYGLKSSGKRWAERFYDIIKDMGFTPSKADPCIWMRENQNLSAMSMWPLMLMTYALLLKIQARSSKPSKRTINSKLKMMEP